MTAEILKKEPLHRGFLNVTAVTARTPQGEVRREVEHHGAAAAVLCYDPERRVALVVEVLRFGPLLEGAEATLLEAAAGMIDKGETPEAAAKRELGEELGLTVSALEPVGAVWATPGVSGERLHLFLAAYSSADRTGEGGGKPEEREGLRPLELPLAELWRRLEPGGVTDLKTVALLQALRLRRPELF